MDKIKLTTIPPCPPGVIGYVSLQNFICFSRELMYFSDKFHLKMEYFLKILLSLENIILWFFIKPLEPTTPAHMGERPILNAVSAWKPLFSIKKQD